MKHSNWLSVALGFFVIATFLGALLRLAFVIEIDWFHFRKFLHAHSHTAMMGWIDLALYFFLRRAFCGPGPPSRRFILAFWASVVSVLGMLITFPIMGYAGWSIFFSTAHLLLSYFLLAAIWRGSKGNGFPELLLKTAILFYFLSTLAVWAVIPFNIQPLHRGSFYYMAVQFFLHFQFNGWFLIACFALLFQWIESKNIAIESQKVKLFWWLVVVSTILSFALAVAWSQPHPLVFVVNSLGAILQIATLFAFFVIIRPMIASIIGPMAVTSRNLLRIAFWALIVKIIAQSFVVVPHFATMGLTIRNFVLGFIHLILLGIISHFLLAMGFISGIWKTYTPTIKAGIFLFSAGFVLSEALLIIQGFMFWGAMGFIPGYYELLFIVSSLIPIGVFMIWLSIVGEKKVIFQNEKDQFYQ